MGEFLNIKIFDSFIVQKSLLPNVSQDFLLSYNQEKVITKMMKLFVTRRREGYKLLDYRDDFEWMVSPELFIKKKHSSHIILRKTKTYF